MIGFSVGTIGSIGGAQKGFFDRAKVQARLNAAERRVLSKWGAFVRQRAISSILRHPVTKGFGAKSKVTNRQGSAPPGEPPYAHLGLIPRFLFFAYEEERHSVVVGPAQLGRSPQAMAALEYGGEETIRFRGRTKRAFYRARPFMHPAFAAELARAAPMFRDQVRE